MNEKEFIYGVSPLERVVSIEPGDSSTEIFTEEKDGTIKSRIVPACHWLLSSTPSNSPGWMPLRGKLPFRYLKTFGDKQAWWKERRANRDAEYINVWDEKEAALLVSGVTYYKGAKLDDISVMAFDIEATGLDHNDTSKVLLISCTFSKNGRVERRLFAYDEYESEGAFFDAWSAYVRECNPSIITGHNIYSYDLPYLDFCASRAGTTLCLGRDGSAIRFDSYESKYRRDGSQFYTYHRASIYGREIVDTFFLSMKYDVARKYESYALKQIIKQEGLEVEERQHYDASKIKAHYQTKTEWEAIKRYAIHDADDALSLFRLMAPSFFYLTRAIPKPFQAIINGASGSQLNSFLLRSYLIEGHSIPAPSEAVPYEGAISVGNPGIYSNVFKVDVASLYPSIMLEYRVADEAKDPLGAFLTMVEFFTKERLDNKAKAKATGERYYKDLEQAQKIVINSAYGMMGAPGLAFNSPVNAARVTALGRAILTKAIEWSKENGYTLVNADTDSISITRDAPSHMADITGALNALTPSRIRWEDDGLYDKVVVLKAKNYVLAQGEKRTIKGSALKASLKEKALKEFIKEIVEALLKGDSCLSIYNRYVTEIVNLTDISRWCSKKTVTEKILNPERSNEQKVLDALEGSDYSQGDKKFFFFTKDGSLSLAEHWNRNHDTDRLLEKLFKTIKIFATVLDVSHFPNYKLKKNKQQLLTVHNADPENEKTREAQCQFTTTAAKPAENTLNLSAL